MKILLSADFHSDFSRLTKLANRVDLCISCGDIFDYHHIYEDQFQFPIPFLSIKGNKEHWGGKKLEQELDNFENFYWLNDHLDKLEALTGLRFFGIDYIREPSVIQNNIDVLITHEPAYGLADQCSDPFHARMVPHCGSKNLRKLINIYPPKYLISGHI
ncbi:MAG: metallophosphoesterase family protein, partial [Candidatus Hodarchaeales archaeon]